ncbi:PREDICTED: ETS homologous factor [Thamnophis sirtalis]|uniref:ETS homologous factor n=1 Tax=Thamnophis sirtalis TaxID=35019 RepID=A0A6I9Z4Z4_9SAUR|nr:PREDICTED: ETS homologous factor [Thamnophis sirtalis]
MILEGTGRMSLNTVTSLLHEQSTWAEGYPTCHAASSSFFGTQWHEIHPQYWTKYQVWEWLQHLLDTNQLDANCIPFQEFDISGDHLCSMTLQDFTRAAGSAGQLLYSNLHHLKWNGQCGTGSEVYPSHNVIVKTEQTVPFFVAEDSSEGKKISQDHPPKPHNKKHTPRGTHLWEFIRDILLHPEKNPGLIKWEDRSEGIFRFLKSEAVAQLWGKKKNNSSMTYEKLSRAMRYYYKREILERVDGRRLVYKFGKNARGWRENEN